MKVALLCLAVVAFVVGTLSYGIVFGENLNFDEAVKIYYEEVKGNPEKEAKVKEFFNQGMIDSINRINENAPQRIDSVTWFNGATYIGHKARYKYGVETKSFVEEGMNEQDIIDMINSDEFAKTYVYTPLCSNPRTKFLIDEMGVTISYMYSDEISNRYLTRIEVSSCK